jgi:hypothetical protein
MSIPMVMITQKELDDLREDAKFLNALYETGVDNWDGYSEACRLVREEEE